MIGCVAKYRLVWVAARLAGSVVGPNPGSFPTSVQLAQLGIGIISFIASVKYEGAKQPASQALDGDRELRHPLGVGRVSLLLRCARTGIFEG